MLLCLVKGLVGCVGDDAIGGLDEVPLDETASARSMVSWFMDVFASLASAAWGPARQG